MDPASVELPPPPRQPSPSGGILSALAWTSGARWGTQLLTWAITIVVARILTPHDYGVIGMAMLVMGVVTLVAEFGVGTVVVTQRIDDPPLLRQLNATAILVGLACFAVVSTSAPVLARFFHSAEFAPVVVVLCATFVVQSAATVPGGLLTQAREFRLLAGVEGGRAATGALVTVVSASHGWGYWALVAGYVAGALVGTIATIAHRPVGFERPQGRVIGPVMRVSLDIVGSRLAWFSYSNADFLVAGRMLGSTPLGVYTMAWTIATAPVDKIAATLNSVSQAFFSSNRDNPGALRSQFLRMTEGIALITMPACLGLALVAEDLVTTVLGPRWAGTVLPLQILSVYTPLRCIAVVLPPLLLVLGESRYLLGCNVAAAVILPLCFLSGSHWGPEGIAAAWAVAYPFMALPLYARSLPGVGVTASRYIRTLRTPALASIGMAVAVLLARQTMPPGLHPVSRLASEVILGAAAWAGSVLVCDRAWVGWLTRLVRQVGAPAAPRDGHP